MERSKDKIKEKKSKKHRKKSKSPVVEKDKVKKKKSHRHHDKKSKKESELERKIDEILFGPTPTVAPVVPQTSVVRSVVVPSRHFNSTPPPRDPGPSENPLKRHHHSHDDKNGRHNHNPSVASSSTKSVAVVPPTFARQPEKFQPSERSQSRSSAQLMSVAVPVYKRPKSAEKLSRPAYDDGRWAHDHFNDDRDDYYPDGGGRRLSPQRNPFDWPPRDPQRGTSLTRHRQELKRSSPQRHFEHDDRWKSDVFAPKHADLRAPRANSLGFKRRNANLEPLGMRSPKFPRESRMTGYQQRDADRPLSPVEPGQLLMGGHSGSPPKDMPDHLRWLHSRWKRHDKTTFEKNFGKRAAADNEQRKKGDKSRWKPTAEVHHTNIKKGSWEEDYLKALEETDPFLDELSPEKLKKIKLDSRVKDETEKARKRAGDKLVQGILEKKGYTSSSHHHSSSSHHRHSHSSRRRSATPERERADRFAGGKYGRPYHEFWKRSATDTSRMMTFKEFLMSVPEDSCETDEMSAKRYAEYRKIFCREACKEFFEAHSAEEWFRQKYHPEYQDAKAIQRCNDVRQRLDVFLQLLVKGWIDVGLDHANSKIVRKTLDAAIVLLEGGSYDQLTALVDLDYYMEERKEIEWEERQKKQVDGEMKDVVVKPPPPPVQPDPSAIPLEEGEAPQPSQSDQPDPTQLEVMQHSKDYRYYFEKQLMLVEDMPDFIGTEAEIAANSLDSKDSTRSLLSSYMVFEPKSKGINEMSLHRASALLLKNIPPTVTHGELDDLLSTLHGGFLRVLLLDPDPKNRFYRHALASFWHNANLAKVAMTLRGYKLHGAPLEVVEYRDHSRRVRMVDGLVADKRIVLRDILTVRNLIHLLDAKYGLWAPPPPCVIEDPPIEEAEDAEEGQLEGETAETSAQPVALEKPIPPRPEIPIPPLLSRSIPVPMPGMLNPLLINLDECVQAKVEEMKNQPKVKVKKSERQIERDDSMVKILDRMILYLRIVHSVDFYGGRFYELEDDAPKRVGPIHIRGEEEKSPSPKHLASHIVEFEEKLKFLFPLATQLSDVEIKELGAKEIDPEVDRFVAENVEPTKDGIEQCRMCEKRFTAREFSKLHLTEKHRETLAEWLQSTFFFNRYLADPSRPCSARFV